MMTQSTGPATRIAVLTSRKRVGASSRLSQPIQSESNGRASRNVALMKSFARRRSFDDRDRRSAHAEKILVGIFDFDANRETLRDTDPVQFAFHIRHTRRREIEFAFSLHRPSDSL